MKYYVQYPIHLDCPLRCPYCFHAEHMRNRILGGPQFEAWKYARWRDTHLRDAEEIVLHFHGGEPSTALNVRLIESVAPSLRDERLDMLTNGLGADEAYDALYALPVKLARIGFTYHRKVIGENEEATKRFIRQVQRACDKHLPVYVKELLFLDKREEILRARDAWEALRVPFFIQDYKGQERGEDFSEFAKYTVEDMKLLTPEYVHSGTECSCIPGHRNVIIRGGWQDGDVLACWIDPVVVGNIHENTYTPGARVVPHADTGKLKVEGVPAVYRGTYSNDRYYENEVASGVRT